MTSNLVGVWSADARFGPGAQSDEMLVFKPNGTGWVEVWNFCLCSVEFFEWTLTSPGWVALAGIRSLALDVKTNKLVESQDVMGVQHLGYRVQEEETPSGQVMKVLWVDVLDFGEGAFGLLDHDVESYPEPQSAARH